MITMQRGERGADLFTDYMNQRLGPRFNQRHIRSVLLRSGSRLTANPAATDDHYPGAVGKPLPERQKSLKISTGQVQPTRPAARGYQQLVVWILSPARHNDIASPIDSGGHG